jgi:hypothetical protein
MSKVEQVVSFGRNIGNRETISLSGRQQSGVPEDNTMLNG